ncbi:MAG: DUF3500 domain-containing protein [Isosphaeraceae bacterium]|nr:DUF3500 domain-containing protein [Isosphaeraceae bacterium]
MRGLKPSVALASVAVIGLALWAGAYVDQSGSRMATAANRFLTALDDSQSKQATFEFDSPERLNWHFIPRERKGLSVKEMTSAQRALAFGLLNTGVSASGSLKATTIMSLEQILKDLEQGKGPVRDPERYFFTVFGKPSDKGRWGWRVEGHHLSLNFTLQDGKIAAATPAFFGANPAEVRQGPRQGLQALADREERALRLVQALKDDQKKLAVVVEKAPADLRAANTPQPPTAAAEGISYAQLNADQRPLLQAIVESYAEDMPADVATAWLDELKKVGVDEIRFAWQGPADRSEGHGYKIQGPTFLIEFNNTQNGANHIHSVWRNMLGDFGIPLASR